MRFENMPVAAIQPCDAPAMVAAIDRLFVEGVDVRRPEGAPFQLKLPLGFNYYPTTGKFSVMALRLRFGRKASTPYS